MANICYFELKVWGDNDSIKELEDLLSGRGKGEKKTIGRAYDFTYTEVSDGEAFGCGNCAWSVASALINITTPSLESELKRLGLTVEIYSSEPGMCFQEHFVFYKGVAALHELEEDYYEVCVEEDSDEEIRKMAAKEHMTVEEFLEEKVHDGWYEQGGFAASGDWDWYTFDEIENFAA